MDLISTYKRIKGEISTEIDSFEVAKTVNEYRKFWMPKKVNIVLLAESHAFTSNEDFEQRIRDDEIQQLGLRHYPKNFVRFVYCLGYGENDILEEPIKNNRGTPDYWKIFYSCCNKINSNSDFIPILKQTPFKLRLNNKIGLLKKLKEMGIWLVDASIVGLYSRSRKFDYRTKQKIISLCWNIYTEPLLYSLEPKYIICIGKEVERTIFGSLRNMEIPYEVITQPNAPLSARERLEGFQTFFPICKKIIQEEFI